VFEELESIDPGSLSEADRLNRELFARPYREDPTLGPEHATPA